MTRIRWRRPALRSLRGPGYVVLSQIFSSLTTFAINIGVARTASEDDFGRFGLLFSAYLLSLSLARSFAIEPEVVRRNSPGLRGSPDSDLVGASMTLPMALAVPAGALLLVGAGMSATTAVVAAAAMWAAMLQDLVKSLALGTGREVVGMVSDLVQLCAQVGLLLLLGSGASLSTSLLTWFMSALAGAVVAVVWLTRRPTPWSGVRHAWRTRAVGMSWAADTALVNTVGQALPWFLAFIGSVSEVAQFRGALVLIGPTTTLFSAARVVVLPRLAAVGPARVPSAARRLGFIFFVIAMAVSLPLLLVPSRLGVQLLGSSWDVARDVLPLAILGRAFNVVGVPMLLGLRAMEVKGSALAVRARVSVLSLVLSVGGGAFWGAGGALAGLALAALIAIPLWLRALDHAGRSLPQAHLGSTSPRTCPDT